MANKLVLLVLLVAIAYCACAHPMGTSCGPNEVFNTCGTACKPTCRNPSPDVCVLKCVIGCQCKQGYVKDEHDNCVLLRNCP